MDAERFGKEIGAWLRQARESRNWSLAKMEAQSAGRYRATAVGTWERADRQIPIERLAGLAEFYGLDLKAMLSASWLAAGGQVPQQRKAA